MIVLQIKDKLLKEAKAVSATTSSEFLRKAIREKQMKRNGKYQSLDYLCLVDANVIKICHVEIITVSVNIPLQPEWLFQRPSLTLDFIVGVDGPTDHVSDQFLYRTKYREPVRSLCHTLHTLLR